jgi:hypothetical protein
MAVSSWTAARSGSTRLGDARNGSRCPGRRWVPRPGPAPPPSGDRERWPPRRWGARLCPWRSRPPPGSGSCCPATSAASAPARRRCWSPRCRPVTGSVWPRLPTTWPWAFTSTSLVPGGPAGTTRTRSPDRPVRTRRPAGNPGHWAAQLGPVDLTDVAEHLGPRLPVGIGAVASPTRSRPPGTSRRARRCRARRRAGRWADGNRLVQAELIVVQVVRSGSTVRSSRAAKLPDHLRMLLGRHPGQRDVPRHLCRPPDGGPRPVEDEPPGRRHLDRTHLVLGHRLRIGRGVEDLEVVQPDEHQGEQGGHQQTDHPQPDDRPRGRGLARGHDPVDHRARGRMRGVRGSAARADGPSSASDRSGAPQRVAQPAPGRAGLRCRGRRPGVSAVRSLAGRTAGVELHPVPPPGWTPARGPAGAGPTPPSAPPGWPGRRRPGWPPPERAPDRPAGLPGSPSTAPRMA